MAGLDFTVFWVLFMFYEIARFPEHLTRALRGSRLTIHGNTHVVRDVLYLPIRGEDWERIRRYSETRAGGGGEVSTYWTDRRDEFVYIYSIDQEVLAISGYFASGYVGQFVDGLGQGLGKPPETEVQKSIFQAFMDNDGPLVRSWYPLLPSLVDHYDLFKNLDAARAIVNHATAANDTGLAVLEIGAGGCLLAMFLHRLAQVRRYDVIDLDFVIPFGFAMLRSFAPEISTALPGEPVADAVVRFRDNNDPAFDEATHDVAVNITSLGEMTQANVADYFALIARVLRAGGVFTCINRNAKVTRFEAYPWHVIPGDVLVDEVDPTSGYHDPDPIYRRIVRKS